MDFFYSSYITVYIQRLALTLVIFLISCAYPTQNEHKNSQNYFQEQHYAEEQKKKEENEKSLEIFKDPGGALMEQAIKTGIDQATGIKQIDIAPETKIFCRVLVFKSAFANPGRLKVKLLKDKMLVKEIDSEIDSSFELLGKFHPGVYRLELSNKIYFGTYQISLPETKDQIFTVNEK